MATPARPRKDAIQLKLWEQLNIGSGQGRFHSEHGLAHLYIVADLAAKESPGAATVRRYPGSIGELPIDIRPAVADVSADVEASPGECRTVCDGLLADGAARRASEI